MYFISIENFDINNLIINLINNNTIDLLYNYGHDIIDELIIEIPWSNKCYLNNTNNQYDFTLTDKNMYFNLIISKYKDILNLVKNYLKKLDNTNDMTIEYKYINKIKNTLQSNFQVNNIINSKNIILTDIKDIVLDKHFYKTDFNIYYSFSVFNLKNEQKLFGRFYLKKINCKPAYFNRKYIDNKLIEQIRISDYKDSKELSI